MAGVRVYELAKELNIDSKELVERLVKGGLHIKNYMSLLDASAFERALQIAAHTPLPTVISYLGDYEPATKQDIPIKHIVRSISRRRRKIMGSMSTLEGAMTEKIPEPWKEKSVCRNSIEERNLALTADVENKPSLEKTEHQPQSGASAVRRKIKDELNFSGKSSETGPANEIDTTKRLTLSDKLFLVDGLNVCCTYSDRNIEVSLESLLTLLLDIRWLGGSFTCLFDANAYFKLRDKGAHRSHILFNKLIDRFPNQFCKVPSGKQADDFILLRAHNGGYSIISNDRFRNYADKYPWIRNGERLIKGCVVSGHLMVPDLDIDIPIRADLDTMFKEIEEDLMRIDAGGRDQ